MFERYTIDFDGKIRQINPSVNGSQFCIATINDEKQSFYLFDSVQNTIDRQIDLSNDVNYSIKAFDEDALVAISYASEGNPDQTDVSYFQWNENEPHNVIPGVSIVQLDAKLLIINHPSIQGQKITLDLKSGQATSGEPKEFHTKAIYPKAYQEENEYFDWFKKLLSKSMIVPRILCEHMKWNDFHWMSTYIGDTSLDNKLYQLDADGEVLESFLLGQNLTGIGKDTFFAIENKLIFVSNYTQLNVLVF